MVNNSIPHLEQHSQVRTKDPAQATTHLQVMIQLLRQQVHRELLPVPACSG